MPVALLALGKKLWWAPVILGLTIGLFVTRATLARVRAEYRVETAQREKAIADAQAANAAKAQAAADSYAAKVASIQPIIVRSIDKVERYATTPAGRAACLAGERVRDIAEDRAALFADPGSGAGAVPPDAAPDS